MKFLMPSLTIFGPFLFGVYFSPKISSFKTKLVHSTELTL